MRLGEAIQSVDFSDKEKQRIGVALLEGQTLQREVLNSKIHSINDNDFWRRAHKQFQVTGFREGQAKPIILQRALHNLKISPEVSRSEIWPLYKRCVVQHVIENLSNLNELLLYEDLEESDGCFTTQIFKSIKSKMLLYKTDIEEIRQLYDLWGFERIENFENIFSEGLIGGELIRKLISKENEKLKKELQQSISNLQNGLLQNSNADQKNLSNITQRIEEINNNLKLSVEALGNDLQELAREAASEHIEKLKEKLLSQTAHVQHNEKKEKVDDKVIEKINLKLEKLEKKLNEKTEIEKNIQELNQVVSPTINLIDTQAFIASWLKAWHTLGYNINNGMLWLTIQLIRRSKVIIAPKPKLISSLFTHYKYCEIKKIVASPLWISETNWNEESKFITNQTNYPKILIIEDFDVAIQEAYLIPTLIKFINSSDNLSDRIILVPSQSDLASVSSRILELSLLLDFDAEWFSSAIQLANSLQIKINSLPPKIDFMDFVKYVETINIEFEKDFRRVFQNIGVPLPSKLIGQFMNVYSILIDEIPKGARIVASETTLLPWLQCNRGESIKRVFEETLKQVVGE